MNLEGCDRKNTLLDISLVLEAERDEFTTDIRLVTHFSDSIMVTDQYIAYPWVCPCHGYQEYTVDPWITM